MTTNQQVVKIKCPHCGWVRRMKLDLESGQEDVACGLDDAGRALHETLQNTLKKIQALLANPAPDEANAWLPMPKCPNCGQAYEYNIHTGETR